jgi:cytoskeletal protein RodZ
LRNIALNEDQKSASTDIEPYIKTWGESLAQARKEAGLDLNDLSRKLVVSKNQLVAIEAGSTKPFHNIFFYIQALKKYKTILNIELTPDPDTVVIKPDRKLKEPNLKDRGTGLKPLKTSKISYRTGSRFQSKTIQYSLVGVLLIVVVSVAIILLRSPSDGTQDQVARFNAEVDSEQITPILVSPALSDPTFSPSPSQTNTPENRSAQAPVLQEATQNAQTPALAQPNQTTQPLPPPVQPTLSQPIAQPLANVTSAPAVTANSPNALAPVTATLADTNQTLQPIAANVFRLSFNDDCWVQAIDKNGTTVEKIFTAGMTFEQPINSLKSLVIGNAGAAQAMLGDTTIDLNEYKNPRSSTARLAENDFTNMQVPR